MRMLIDTGRKRPTAMPPCEELKQILNEEECGVWSVEITLRGRLFYRKKGSLRRHYDIQSVQFRDSYVERSYAPKWAVHADFDIITADGRVIEVSTWHKRIIESALELAPMPNPRGHIRIVGRGAHGR